MGLRKTLRKVGRGIASAYGDSYDDEYIDARAAELRRALMIEDERRADQREAREAQRA